MKLLFLFLFFIGFGHKLIAQDSLHTFHKPVIDSSVFENWPAVENPLLSDDGKYAFYTIINIPKRERTLVIQSTINNWKKEYIGASEASFAANSKVAIFMQGKDTLCLLNLESDVLSYIPVIASYKLSMVKGCDWIAYQENDSSQTLVVRNLVTNSMQQIKSVVEYLFDSSGSSLLLEITEQKGKKAQFALEFLSLEIGKSMSIWSGTEKCDISLDPSHKQIAFVSRETDNKNQRHFSIWYYKFGMHSAVLSVSDSAVGKWGNYIVSDMPPEFSKDGRSIFFSICEENNQKQDASSGEVTLLKYNDAKLQSGALRRSPAVKYYKSIFNPDDSSIFRIENVNERIFGQVGRINGGFVIVYNDQGDSREIYWNKKWRPSVFLVSMKTGERKELVGQLEHWSELPMVSPDGKYVLRFDAKSNSYFCRRANDVYDINVTKYISTSLVDEKYDQPNIQPYNLGIDNWLPDDFGFFIYDEYDIWLVDPSGTRMPINITNGYGRTHHLKFRLVKDEHKNIVEINDKGHSDLLLTAFSPVTKFNGFFSKNIKEPGNPKLLTLGPYDLLHDVSQSSSTSFLSPVFTPRKARDTCLWIVRRMSTTESPNYFTTVDFKKFKQLSDVNPQRKFNWLSGDLVRWKTFDGSFSEGILYKPENFDPNRKYPVIIHIYEKLSDRLYTYLEPGPTGDDLNIPFFVSNGYLVFTPDIHYTIGKTGQSVYNSVVSAAYYLAKMPWVNALKMGIQGHSFGGYEINYLVTSTNIFAAAQEGAGASDFVSYYNSLFAENSSQFYFEKGQGRIAGTLWDKGPSYFENSPIFKVNRVTTPLLIVHNENDGQVPFEQGIELFTALRRLGKKAWMLEYDGQGHGLSINPARDFTTRLMEYFDYYLKGTLPPKWMTDGIYGMRGGVDSSLDLDKSGRVP